MKYLHLATAELAAGDRAAAGAALEKARKIGLGQTRLVQQDAERIENLEASLGQTAAVNLSRE